MECPPGEPFEQNGGRDSNAGRGVSGRKRTYALPSFSLPPVPLMKHPAASAVDVARRHPNDAGPRRANPTPRDPHISGAIPTLVSANPHISGSGSNSDHPDSDRRRRRYANHCRLCNSDYSSQQQYDANSGTTEIHFTISFSASVSFRWSERELRLCSPIQPGNWQNSQSPRLALAIQPRSYKQVLLPVAHL